MARILLLPTTMGTQLRQRRQTIWLDLSSLQWGDLALLARDQPGILPHGPLPAYQALQTFLARAGHEVIPIGWDWRDSFLAQSQRLNEALQRYCTPETPCHILAHGSGAWLVNALIHAHPQGQESFLAHPDNRLILLGLPPVGGRYDLVQLLSGQHRLIRLLETFLPQGPPSADDGGTNLLLNQFAQYPGILEQLPDPFFSPENWRALPQHPQWHDPVMLKRARKAAQRLRQPLPEALKARTWLIAGAAPLTPQMPDRQGRFTATEQGDGIMPWQTRQALGIDDARCLFCPLEQGRLAVDPTAFPLIARCLHAEIDSGPKPSCPTPASAPSVYLPPLTKVPRPSETELTAAALGFHTLLAREEILPPARIEVIHGDLRYATEPVMVGHYRGDGLFSAEKALNDALQGRLQQHHRLGVYPGELNTFKLFLSPNGTPPGALIVGLGDVGELTAHRLQATFYTALLNYALERAPQQASPAKTAPAPVCQPVSLASLLIGASEESGLCLEDTLRALLQAIMQVNRLLCKSERQPVPRLQRIQLIELFEDRALEAAHLLESLLRQEPYLYHFQLRTPLRQLPGGQIRLTHLHASRWWQRLQIEGLPDGRLRYRILSRRARVEVQLQPTQRRLVDRFLHTALATDKQRPELGRTLFELLLPRSLRDQLQTRDALILQLDRETARYPWELLQDPQNPAERPLTLQTRLIRQLQIQRYREQVRYPMQRLALVIGDPLSPPTFPDLPAAEGEALKVARQLQQAGFRVAQEIRTNATSVIQALHRNSWRVLHLTGHGVFEYPRDDGEKVTGLALSDGLFLTATEIAQMRQTPELVFINACHLGRLSPATDPTRAPRLAASLAEALIAMGVRAVIAAGWAVQDDAAALFAQTFYARMLEGKTLGDAIHAARQIVWRRFPDFNTWGAYQCYGTPDWQLVSERRPTTSTAAARFPLPDTLFSTREVDIALKNLKQRTGIAPLAVHEPLRLALDTLWRRCPSAWRTHPTLRRQRDALAIALDRPQAVLRAPDAHPLHAGAAALLQLLQTRTPAESAHTMKTLRDALRQLDALASLLPLEVPPEWVELLETWRLEARIATASPDHLRRHAAQLQRHCLRLAKRIPALSCEASLMWAGIHGLRYRIGWIERRQTARLQALLAAPAEERQAADAALPDFMAPLPAPWLQIWQQSLARLMQKNAEPDPLTDFDDNALQDRLANAPAAPFQARRLQLHWQCLVALAQPHARTRRFAEALEKALQTLKALADA